LLEAKGFEAIGKPFLVGTAGNCIWNNFTVTLVLSLVFA